MNLDDNTLGKRLRRYGQVAGGAGKLGAQLLSQKAFSNGEFPDLLVDWLGKLKGPLVKVGQILAMIPDFLPPDYQEKLLELQSNAPAMGWLFVKRRMHAELGENWQNRFQRFSHEAVAAASLGQVHEAMSLQGVPLACKLQYPDMASTVTADLEQLSMVLKGYHIYEKALDHVDILTEIRTRLLEEIDYHHEVHNIQRFSHIWENHHDIYVPEVDISLSTKRLITMSWCNGCSFQEFFQAPADVRNDLARRLFIAWYYPLYTYGALHGDPHFGNYKVMDDGKLGLLDFGCVRYFSPQFVVAVTELYWALLYDDKERAVYAYEGLGFHDLHQDLIQALNVWARYLYGPLLEDRVRPIEASFSSREGRAVATEVYTKLRTLGGIRPPQEFVFLDRSALVLGSVFMHLNAECNWYQLFHSLIEGMDSYTLAQRQNTLLKE